MPVKTRERWRKGDREGGRDLGPQSQEDGDPIVMTQILRINFIHFLIVIYNFHYIYLYWIDILLFISI